MKLLNDHPSFTVCLPVDAQGGKAIHLKVLLKTIASHQRSMEKITV